jgi:alanyl-tRNA synthetase
MAVWINRRLVWRGVRIWCALLAMDADQIRSALVEYMAERGHTVIPRAPLIPRNDPATLFTGSGMQPLLPYLLGQDHPEPSARSIPRRVLGFQLGWS